MSIKRGDEYPSWVCKDCCEKAGGKFPDDLLETVHTGECEVCGETKTVFPPRAFGNPDFGKID